MPQRRERSRTSHEHLENSHEPVLVRFLVPARFLTDRQGLPVATASVLLGLLLLIESLGPLLIGLGLVSSPRLLALPSVTTAGLPTVMLLQLVVGGNLLLFASDNGNRFFWPSCPPAPLLVPLLLAQLATTLICSMGMLLEPISWPVIGWVWAYNLMWLVILRAAWFAGRRLAISLAANRLDAAHSGAERSAVAETSGRDRDYRLQPCLMSGSNATDTRRS